MAITYDFISKITTSGASSVSFTSIPQTYTDLVLVYSPQSASSNSYSYYTINGDTSSTYYRMCMAGTGSTITPFWGGDVGLLYPYYGTYNDTTSQTLFTSHFMNYSNTTSGKVVLTRSGNTGASNLADFSSGYYASNTAITRIDVFQGGQNFANNVVFSLYGIKAA